jgi:hypothetical protein
MSWWIWILVGFALLAIEFASTTMHIGFFAAGAFLVGIAVGLGWNGPLWAQLLVFTVTSLLALLVFRPIVMRKLKLQSGNGPRVDELVGEVATALEEIAASAIGKAELRGSTWSAGRRRARRCSTPCTTANSKACSTSTARSRK